MSADDRGESLSFLDVLTNGMGSLLVLFVLMAALRATEELGEADDFSQAAPGNEGSALAVKPFVLVVSSASGEALAKEPGWRIGDPDFDKKAKRGGSVNLAFLYAETPPEVGCRIDLHGLRAETRVAIHLFRDKALLFSATAKTTKEGTLPLWPVPEKGGKP